MNTDEHGLAWEEIAEKVIGCTVCLAVNSGGMGFQVRCNLNPALPQAWSHPADDLSSE